MVYTPSIKSLLLHSSSLADNYSQFDQKCLNTKVKHLDKHIFKQYIENENTSSELNQAIESGNVSDVIDVLQKHMSIATQKSKLKIQTVGFPHISHDISQSMCNCELLYKELFRHHR